MSSVSIAALTATALRMTLTTMPQPQSKCPSLMRTNRPGLKKCKQIEGCCIVDSITVSYLAMSCSMQGSTWGKLWDWHCDCDCVMLSALDREPPICESKGQEAKGENKRKDNGEGEVERQSKVMSMGRCRSKSRVR